MEIILNNRNKRITDLSVPDMSSGVSVQAEVRGEVSLMSPLFTLTRRYDYYQFNYIYVPMWKRYYFITDVSINGNLQTIKCDIDVLASWYDEICASSFWCTRSASDYNENITDTIYPAETQCYFASVGVTTPWKGIMDGYYLIAIASGGNETPHIGTNAYYIMNQDLMTQFMDYLMGYADMSLSGIADSIAKAMVNPMQYIRSCIWLPVNLSDKNYVTESSIKFGWWSSNVEAVVLQFEKNADTTVTITKTIPYDSTMFSDDLFIREYMKYPPYSKLTLTAYPFGVIDIPQTLQTEYVNGRDIIATITLDLLTGMGTLVLTASGYSNTPLYVTTTKVGVEVPIGEVIQDYAGAAIHTLSAAGSLLSGNLIGAAQGVYSAIDSATPDVSVSGANGGFGQLMLDSDWVLERRSYHVPNINTSMYGSPCCKTEKISDLEGFCQFDSVDMQGAMMEDEKARIKELLESGIFKGDNNNQ